MSNIGIYPGTFDPITYGHIDVIKRSLKIVDKLIIGVSNDYSKNCLFSADERVSIIKNALFRDLNFKTKIIKMVGIVESSYYREPSGGQKGNKPSKLTYHHTKGFVDQVGNIAGNAQEQAANAFNFLKKAAGR